MKKLILAAVAAVIALAVILPIINLIVGLPKGVKLGSEAGAPQAYLTAVHALGEKCGNCHTDQGNLPFYAALPVASSLVKGDIQKGTEHLDMVATFAKAPAEPICEATLAKLEHVILKESMPPARYLAMHWDGALTADEKKAVVSWIHEVRAARYSSPAAPDNLKTAVIQPIPQPQKLDEKKVALGKRLYHDTRLSKDNTLSCASCHDLAKGGTDREPVSTGVGGAKGGINAPTVYNAALQIAQFWDGRAADLAAQAAGPPANPIEMASSWPEIVQKLSQDAAFKAEFEASYPGGITQENVCDAIATFEKTLLTPNSPFDRFLLGDKSALTEAAKKGHALFMDAGCATCHAGMAMGGRSYEKMGLHADYFANRRNPTDADNGRASVTKQPRDKHRFKTPLLRNVALTPPYFHDASAKTLAEAVRKMGTYQLGRNFTDQETSNLVAFLESLTGEFEGKKLQ
ncbi:MAG TPA: cytochrome c peroxidase [Verrucomicrobiae bacterium]|nr:cytochrome c peroxidase [Verrucomicrobiae bacterium]